MNTPITKKSKRRASISRIRSSEKIVARRRDNASGGRQALLVLGMHRSGTSAITRIFNLLGADLPKNLMSSGPGNELGHWESNDLVIIHDDLLTSAGSKWDDWRAFNPDWYESNVSGP